MSITGSSRPKRAATAISLAALCGTVAYLNIPSINNSNISQSSVLGIESLPLSASLPSSGETIKYNRQRQRQHRVRNNRRLSEALPNGGCQITWPQKPPPDVQISYAASYPGCGARMTWNLVEALTGLQTGDDWNNNGRGKEVVTVKTHYPQSNGILVDFDDTIQRGFIVIRNPMKSIPSFFNHIYEMRNHLPVHSERAPLDEWIKWRNAYLETEIAEYKKFIIYWMDRFTPENRLLITYEGLTDDLIGAEVTKGLNDFLGKAQGVTTIHPDSVACIWRAVVKNEPPPQQAAHIKKLQSLAQNQPQNAPEVQPRVNAQVEDGEKQFAALSAQLQQQQQQGDGGSSLSNTALLDPQQQQGGGGSLSNAALLEQTLQNIQNKPLDLSPAGDGGLGSSLAPGGGVALDQQLLDAQQKLLLLQSQQQAAPAAPPAELPLDQQLLEMQQKLLAAQSLLGQDQGSGGVRRRLDPGHHDSQRAGPEVPRPYTPQQLDMIMTMLLEVAQRYSEADARLYHIMMGYYEKIRGERAKLSMDDPNSLQPPGGFF